MGSILVFEANRSMKTPRVWIIDWPPLLRLQSGRWGL